MHPLDPHAQTIVDFLRSIGLDVRLEPIAGKTFLPGIALMPDGLLVDPTALKYPGDLLHEAGHLATMLPTERAAATTAGDDIGQEIAAQCWSYAAAVHLKLAPEVVFHPDGYHGASRMLIEHYSGSKVGVPLLQWMGLTLDADRAAEQNVLPYPHMNAWLRMG